MTKNPIIAGLAAGGVAALLYLSLATGSAIGLLLFYLAPLPGFIVGFGWGIRAAAIAGLAGTALIIGSLGFMPATAYAASLAIPSIILTHYTFLYRLLEPSSAPDGPTAETQIEWYPAGNLILTVAVYGGVLAMLTILLLGPSYEAYLERIGSELDLIISKATNAGFFKKLKPDELAAYKQLVQSALPASTAILWSLFTLVNMWIAGHITRFSELLKRPWPDLTRIEFPRQASFILIGLLLASVILPGLAGLIISAFAGALLVAFLLLGLAVVHYLTRPYPARNLMLFGTYIAVFFIGWGSILLIVLGVIEPLVQLRKRSSSPPT